jgi:hypothetical protein
LTCSHAALAAVLILATPGPAQRTPTHGVPSAPRVMSVDAARIEHLRRELAAEDLKRRAWAAWEASDKLVRELAPDILAALQVTTAEPASDPRTAALGSLLDAAIRLEVRPAAIDLLAVFDTSRFSPQLLVLASRSPSLHVRLLEDLRAQRGELVRRAANNLLAAGAPTRAVELLLPDARIHIRVRVHDGRAAEESRGWSAIACGTRRVPRGFPPTVRYGLTERTLPDPTVFADGPLPIAAQRSVHRGLDVPTGGTLNVRDEHDQELGLLRWIAGDRAREGALEAEILVEVMWTTATAYLAAVEPEIQARQAAWTQLVDALVARGLLAPEQRPAKAPIEVVVEDLRTDTSVPLPGLPR